MPESSRSIKRYKSWSVCSSCGFQGTFIFTSWEGEDYHDPDSLGAMLDSTCPSCGESESVLVAAEEFRRMAPLR